MPSNNKNIKYNSERITFSKHIKRKIMLDIIRGKHPSEAFLDNGFDMSLNESNDKKYIAKLFHKWKSEVYKNRELIYPVELNPDDEFLKNEMLILSLNEEMEDFE